MRIFDNQYKIGQRVGVVDYDNPLKIFGAWVVGVDLDDNGREITYTIAEELKFEKYPSSLSDGWPEDKLRSEDSINTI